MVNLNANVSGISNPFKSMLESSAVKPKVGSDSSAIPKVGDYNNKTDFADAVKNYISKVDDVQQSSNMSIKDLLLGNNEDITSPLPVSSCR